MIQDIAAIRSEYARAGLDERDLHPSPMKQLEKWLGDAIDAKHPEPTAMTLATASLNGEPAARSLPATRVVLIKAIDERGLVFYTNYDSDKGRAIAENPLVSANIFWVMLERQIRISARVEKTTREESESYFKSRPRESQLGAWASKQSAVIASRSVLEQELSAIRARFGEGEVPCPPHWGGYRLIPSSVEFWQGRPSRLHDRLRYTRVGEESPVSSLQSPVGSRSRDDEDQNPISSGSHWMIERLSP